MTNESSLTKSRRMKMARMKLSMGKINAGLRGVGRAAPVRASIRATHRAVRMAASRHKGLGKPMVVKVAGVRRTPRQVRVVRVAAKRAVRAFARRARAVNKAARQRIIGARKVARVQLKRLAKGMAKVRAGARARLKVARASAAVKAARQRVATARRAATIRLKRLAKGMARRGAATKARLNMAKARAAIKNRIAAIKAKIKKAPAARIVKNPAIIKRILARRGGYTKLSLQRKGRLGKLNDHHIVPYSLRNHPVMKHLVGLNRDFHINARGNRILLRLQKVAGEKRGLHSKGYSKRHQAYNRLVRMNLNRIQKLDQSQWTKEVQSLQAGLRKGFRGGKFSLD